MTGSFSFYSPQITYSFTGRKTDKRFYFRLYSLILSSTFDGFTPYRQKDSCWRKLMQSLSLARRESVSHYLVALSPTFRIICLSIEFKSIITETVQFWKRLLRISGASTSWPRKAYSGWITVATKLSVKELKSESWLQSQFWTRNEQSGTTRKPHCTSDNC